MMKPSRGNPGLVLDLRIHVGGSYAELEIRGWDYSDYNIPLMSSPMWRFTVLSCCAFLQLQYITLLKHIRTIYNLPFCHLHPLLPLLTVEVGCFQQGPEIRFRSLRGRDISPGQSWKNGRSLSHSGDLKVLEKFLINVNLIVPRPITLFLWNIPGCFWTIILDYIYCTFYIVLLFPDGYSIVILSESTSTPYEFQILAA